MNNGRMACHRPHFRVLSDFQIERLYQATLRCLERTGVNVFNAEGRALLVEAGAEAEGVRVRLPRGLIEETLAMAPPSFRLWHRPCASREDQDASAFLEVCATEL